ncbi:MAG: hypothetical protein N2039_14760, partial [Gemmataceae bacterium]|nr:hypothetical protein [Gemmataceae bacterium]
MTKRSGNLTALGLFKWLALSALLLFGLLLVIFLAGSWVWNYQADSAWAAIAKELDQKDPDWRWESIERQRRVVPDSENSARTIIRIQEMTGGREGLEIGRRIAAEPLDLRPPDADEPSDEVEPLPMPDEWIEGSLPVAIEMLELGERLPPVLRRELERALSVYAEAIAVGDRLADQPFGRHPLQVTEDVFSTPLATQQFARSVVTLMVLEGQRRAAAGDCSHAWRALRSAFNAARSLGDEPFLISALIRIAGTQMTIRHAEKVLAVGEVREAELAAWRKLLELEIAEPRLNQCLRGERAMIVKFTDTALSGKISPSQIVAERVSSPQFLEDWIARKLIRQSRPETIRLLTELIEQTRQPADAWIEAIEEWSDRVKQSDLFLARLFGTSMGSVAETEVRHQALLRVALMATACEQFRQKHQRWPNDPVELATEKFLDQLPTDPYT